MGNLKLHRIGQSILNIGKRILESRPLDSRVQNIRNIYGNIYDNTEQYYFCSDIKSQKCKNVYERQIECKWRFKKEILRTSIEAIP